MSDPSDTGTADERPGTEQTEPRATDGGSERGYRTVAVDEVENTPNPTRVKRELDEALGVSAFGCNYYEADPGEQVPWGYHRHPDHEELFYVIAGAIDVETPEGQYRVAENEAFFVPADAPNRAVATGDEPARILAVGAPKTDDGSVIEERCPACGEVTDREWDRDEGRDGAEVYVLSCADCGAETRRFSGRTEMKES
ncbi:cupin domain-containing protein [Candidatus Halobonum tyrrellensis]|uniref:Cupin n=1 Tax=Candidatus Halobonum tyrrellensis G22 TaxID=1324957 RepID=V4GV50_9EURY|nr:cupin domain-containing protein [Candidatus Halobonum tyrrellensis]ESP89021.1 cupin [Candidatus Halobonum tyrrellensis G22]